MELYGFVYRIENRVNNKSYIGLTTNFKQRKIDHFKKLRKNQHPNIHLQNSFNKYGESNFKFSILNWANSKEELDKQEIYFINKYGVLDPKNGYNVQTGGSNGKHSLESRKKISESKKGMKRSLEIRKKISESRIGKYSGKNNPMYGKKHSSLTIKKMKESQKGRKYPNRCGKNHPNFGKKVTWHKFRGCYYNNSKKCNPWTKVWRSTIKYKGTSKTLGLFNDPLTAEIVYKLVWDEIHLSY